MVCLKVEHRKVLAFEAQSVLVSVWFGRLLISPFLKIPVTNK